MDLLFLKRVPLQQYPWFLNLQFINLLLPLISYPYLLRVIGPEKYGLIAVANAVGALIATLSEYGYSFTGVKDIARIADNTPKLVRYLSNAIFIRVAVFIICCTVFFPIGMYTALGNAEYLLFTLTVAAILPSLLYPQWLFVGLQKVRQLNYILVVNKVLSVGLVFILISDVSDYRIFPLINLIPALFSAAMSIWYLRMLGVKIQFFSGENIWSEIRSGFYPFVSQSFTALYVQLNPILLMAFLRDSTLVGYYAVAERIVLLVKGIFSPLNQLFLPGISSHFLKSPATAVRDVIQYSKIVGAANLVGMLVLIIFSEQIVLLFAGDQFIQSVAAIQLLSPMILFVALNNLAGIHLLLNLEMKKEFFIGIFCGVAANILLLILLIPYVSYISPAISWTVSEAIVLAVFVLYLVKRKQEWM